MVAKIGSGCRPIQKTRGHLITGRQAKQQSNLAPRTNRANDYLADKSHLLVQRNPRLLCPLAGHVFMFDDCSIESIIRIIPANTSTPFNSTKCNNNLLGRRINAVSKYPQRNVSNLCSKHTSEIIESISNLFVLHVKSSLVKTLQ